MERVQRLFETIGEGRRGMRSCSNASSRQLPSKAHSRCLINSSVMKRLPECFPSVACAQRKQPRSEITRGIQRCATVLRPRTGDEPNSETEKRRLCLRWNLITFVGDGEDVHA